MTVHTSIHHIIMIFIMTVVGVMVVCAGFLIYDIITGIKKWWKNR